MFKRIKNLENDFTVGKAAMIIGFFTLLSKLVGLVRDPIFASKIGAGDTLDIYYAAFRIPDLIFTLLILGTLSVALIPVLSEWFIKDEIKANRLVNSVLNTAILGMGLVCIILLVFSAPFTKLLVPGFPIEKYERTVQLMRLFLMSPLIFTVSSVFTSLLSARKKFLMLSIAPIMYNLGILGGLFFLYPHFGLMGLGYGVIIGALMHLLVQIPEAIRFGYRWQPLIEWNDPSFRKIVKLFLPRIIGMDISQVSLLIGTTVGSFLAAGTVTIFTFANNLQAAPLGVFALSISAASFPLLSEYFSKNDHVEYMRTLAKNICLVLFYIIPLATLMFIFRNYIIEILYNHGKFTPEDIIKMVATFGILSLSLIGQSLSPLFSRAFYSRQNTIIPVVVNLCSILLDAVLAFVLGKKFGLVGLASGFAIACSLDALLMFIFLRRTLTREKISWVDFDSSVKAFFGKIFASTAVMAIVSILTIHIFLPFANPRNFFDLITLSGLSVGTALSAFLLASSKLGLEQTKDFLAFFRKML